MPMIRYVSNNGKQRDNNWINYHHWEHREEQDPQSSWVMDNNNYFVVLLFLLSSCPSNIASQEYKLKILHNNDFHSRFAPISSDGSPCDDKKNDKCIGGVARTVHLVSVSILRLCIYRNNRLKNLNLQKIKMFYSWMLETFIKEAYGTRYTSIAS